jgi:hypothetical protein
LERGGEKERNKVFVEKEMFVRIEKKDFLIEK